MNPIAVLISTYELGRQPFGLASPAAWLRRAGWDVTCLDLAKERLREDALVSASLVAFHLPMHTATRLAAGAIAKARHINPSARFCAYGLYAPPNAQWLASLGVDDVIGAEFEEDLTAIATTVASGAGPGPASADAGRARPLPRIHFLVPDRSGLLPLDRYATLTMPDGSRRVVGSTEASRGCRHTCRHCPIVPIYQGQFRIVQPDVVLADVANQVAAGAQHVTFADPDFLNGPRHAMRVVDAMHAAHPELTYDVTIKVEHLLQHRHLLGRLRDTGCLFVTSAVESLDDAVLARLEKGHTRRDFLEAVGLCQSVGLTLVPTFVAFHPWLTLDGYCDLVDTIDTLDLVEHVSPIQLAIRLLVPKGSKLLDLPEMPGLIGGFDPVTLAYRWAHRDPRVDDLQRRISSLVGIKSSANRRQLFDEVSELAHERAGIPRTAPPSSPGTRRASVPHLNEPWYCCAEPNIDQVTLI